MTTDALPTVLHVDPSADVADRLRDALSAVGDFDIAHVETASAARAAGGVDAVVSEYALPDATGLDLLSDLRESKPGLPFVVLTGHGSESVASDAIARDVTGYVPKGDGDVDRVAATIRDELARREPTELGLDAAAVLASVPDPLVVFDDSGTIRYANGPASDLLAVDPDAIVGRDVFDFLAAEEAVSNRVEFEQYVRAGTSLGRRRDVKLDLAVDGRRPTVGLSLGEFRADGRRQFVAVFRDRSVEPPTEDDQFRQVLENIDEVVWLVDYPDREVRYVNPAYEDVFAEPAEKAYEWPFPVPSAVHPDDRDRVMEAYERLPERGADVEYRIERPDGEVRCVHERAVPLAQEDDRRRVVSIAEDVTGQRQAERERREMLDRMTDGFFALDADWRLVYYNTRASETFDRLGVDLASGIGDSYWDLIPAIRGTVFEDQFRRAMETGEPVTFEAYFDPTDMWVEARVFPSETGLSVYFRDVTERHEREAELRRQNERLDQFATIVSHDLRNPLGVATGHLGFARDKYDDEDLEATADALDRIETIVQDVLSLAREGRIVRDRDPVSLEAVARDAWTTIAPGNADLVVDADLQLSADRSRLRQVFENLFHNAVTHTPGGPRAEPTGESPGVTVRVGLITGPHAAAEPTIELGDRSVVGFYVEDDGPGIPEADRDLVFRPGYTTGEQGTGFGLPIVEQILLAHGWRVQVTESEAGGARFEVTDVTPIERP